MKKKKEKKTPTYNVTYEDIQNYIKQGYEKGKEHSIERATNLSVAVPLMVLRDEFGFGNKRLTPTIELERFKPLTVKEYTRDFCGRTFYISDCPKCGCGLDGNQVQKYCHECGQRLE